MLSFEVEQYDKYVKRVPYSGRYILCYSDNKTILVYQAFNDSIADFAIEIGHLQTEDLSKF